MTAPPLEAWGWDSLRAEPLGGGLINQSFEVRDGDDVVAIVQRLNTRIFDPAIHHTIETVTRWLEARGVPTPTLIPPRTPPHSGALWAEVPAEDGVAVWRALTPVGDTTLASLDDPALATEAGALVGRFHAATAGLRLPPSARPFHDTPARVQGLREAIAAHPDHEAADAVRRLADPLFAAWEGLRGTLPAGLPQRVIHGDLKLTNLRFLGRRAHALIDLDTLAMGTLDAELGDALRSWTGVGGEEAEDTHVDAALFEAALTGWARGWRANQGSNHGPTDDEWAAIPGGLARISLELTCRFAADALEVRYFGWDASRYPSATAHHLARARSQARLAFDALARREALDAAVARAREAAHPHR